MSWLVSIGRFTGFCLEFARASMFRAPPRGHTVEEAYRIGVKSLPVLLVISIFVGTNLALQGYHAFVPLGGQRLVGMFVALAGVREMAPILAAAMVAAKAGTEMASQLAVMRTREQIDALEVMAVNPLWWLVTPRLLAIAIVMPALTTIAIVTTILAAWGVSTLQLGLNSSEFLQYVRDSIEGRDLVVCQVKGVVFGVVICLVSCYCGYHSKRGPDGVGQATNAAVVAASVVCVTINYLVSQATYG